MTSFQLFSASGHKIDNLIIKIQIKLDSIIYVILILSKKLNRYFQHNTP